MAGPKFAGRQLAERFKPCGQRGADFHQPARAVLALARRHFDMPRHAPHVRPIQPQHFGGGGLSEIQELGDLIVGPLNDKATTHPKCGEDDLKYLSEDHL